MLDFEVTYRTFDVREILNLRKIFKTRQRKTKVPSLTNLIKINLCSLKVDFRKFASYETFTENSFIYEFVTCKYIQCVPLATEPGISLIILTPMKISQRNF
jgi:hypothetical protein